MPQDPTLVEVRRSRRRKSTVSAYRDGDRTVVAIPARFSRAQEREWVARMLARLEDKERRRRPSDERLQKRAVELSRRYLGSQARIGSVRWSTNQGRRWGSCTVATGDIRLSSRLRGMPEWVIDYVLLHELAHTIVPGHSPEFWALLDGYARTERARGFLEGVAFVKELPPDDEDEDEDENEEPDGDAVDHDDARAETPATAEGLPDQDEGA